MSIFGPNRCCHPLPCQCIISHHIFPSSIWPGSQNARPLLGDMATSGFPAWLESTPQGRFCVHAAMANRTMKSWFQFRFRTPICFSVFEKQPPVRSQLVQLRSREENQGLSTCSSGQSTCQNKHTNTRSNV